MHRYVMVVHHQPGCFRWLQEGKLDIAIEALLNLEKQFRLSADVTGTRKVAVAIVQLCREAEQWKTLNDQIMLLSKRRAQLKQVLHLRECLTCIVQFSRLHVIASFKMLALWIRSFWN